MSPCLSWYRREGSVDWQVPSHWQCLSRLRGKWVRLLLHIYMLLYWLSCSPSFWRVYHRCYARPEYHANQIAPQFLGLFQAFQTLCEMFGLRPSPQIFLHCYSSRPTSPVDWLSLVNQYGSALFSPFIVSYKKFKTRFFHVTIKPTGQKYIFNRDTLKFPFY